jgi:hypothetical protein
MSKKLLREFHALCPNGVCDITLLNEQEKHLKNNGYTVLTGIMQTAEVRNGNGRIYPKRTLEREMENYQKLIKENRACGQIDHPESEIVELANASHMVIRTWWENNEVWGSIKVLKSTPSGQILEGLIKDGVQLGISSRALGSVKETSQGTMVEDDLTLIAFDIVSEPSTPNAYMHLREMKEIKNNKILTKADRINRALNDILRKE